MENCVVAPELVKESAVHLPKDNGRTVHDAPESVICSDASTTREIRKDVELPLVYEKVDYPAVSAFKT